MNGPAAAAANAHVFNLTQPVSSKLLHLGTNPNNTDVPVHWAM